MPPIDDADDDQDDDLEAPAGGAAAGDQAGADDKVEGDAPAGGAEGGDGAAAAEGGDSRLSAEAQGESPEDRRARHRQERQDRKESQRRQRAARDRQLEELKAFKADAAPRLEALERITSTIGVQNIDTRLAGARAKLRESDDAVAAAMESGDADAMRKAVAAGREADHEVRVLQSVKARATADAGGGERNDRSDRRAANEGDDATDPVIASRAREWHRDHQWYRPGGTDADSVATGRIDKKLMAEGFDPREPDYWTEFNARIAKDLPHRAAGRNGGGNGQRPANGGGNAARGPAMSMRNGNNGGGGGGSDKTLTPDRIDALKQLGVWGDKDAMKPYVEEFKKYDADRAAEARAGAR